MLWFWLVAAPALLLSLASLISERGRAAYIERRLHAEITGLPPASVIVPVKGEDHGLRQNLAALASLDYPDYELIITAHAAADIPPAVLPANAKIVLAHGSETKASEKVQNLAAAVHATRQQTRIFAFADSDGRVTPGWLRALVAPLGEPGVGAATGYRWFLPESGRLPSLLRGVWDAVPAGMLGPGDNPFVWGGAMALPKKIFAESGVLEYWENAISDDYSLSEAVHAAGYTIAFAPGALTPSPEPISALGLFSWTRRQMMITRAYNFRMWFRGLVAHLFYCGAMAACLAAGLHGHHVAWWTLAALLLPGMGKAAHRLALARACLPEYARWFRRYGWVHVALVPLATWLWLISLLSSSFGSTIKWRGYRYDLKERVVDQRV
ncbi:MAG: glycosyltransferase family 2 protein [Acidobacteriia bacterium]|nr:glycosyltransferase family 2 protein [Terriglobia bacterium]